MDMGLESLHKQYFFYKALIYEDLYSFIIHQGMYKGFGSVSDFKENKKVCKHWENW